MPLQTQYVPVDLGGQLDQKTDERLVVPGNFINLENTVYTKTGSVRKRPGNDLIVPNVLGGGTLPAPRSLVGYRDTLLMFGSENMYALSGNQSYWINKGQIPEPTVSQDLVTSTKAPSLAIPPPSAPSIGDHWLTCAKTNGITVYLHESADSTTVRGTAIDDNGNVLFANNTVNSSAIGNNPRIAAVGNFIIAIYSDASNIYAKKLDTTNPIGFGSEVTLATNFSGGLWDACSLGDRFAVAYHGSVIGVDSVVTKTFNSSLVALNATAQSQSLSPDITVVAIAPNEAQNSVWVSWTTDDGTTWFYRCEQYNLTLGTVTSATTIDSGLITGGFGRYRTRIGIAFLANDADALFVSNTPVDGVNDSVMIDNVQSVTGSVNTLYAGQRFHSLILLVSKPFSVNGVYYVAVRDKTESTFYLANIGLVDFINQLMIPVATYADQAANNNDDSVGAFAQSLLCDIAEITDTSVLIPGLTTLGETLNVSGFIVSFDTAFTFAESNEALCVSGGLPGSYAESKFVELGFLQRPVVTNATFTAGTTFPTGIYRYFVVYEWTDENGQIFRSHPSAGPISVTVASTAGTIVFDVSNIAFTRKQRHDADVDAVRIVIYREQVINNGVYVRMTQITNKVTTLTQHFVDDGSFNTALAASTTVLYTQTELPNSHPSSATFVLTHAGRVWLAGFDDQTQLWGSKQISEGECPNFSEVLRLNIHDGGAITGLASMDNKLIVFKKDRIYVIVGDGPNDLGGANDWQIQRVAADTGCIDGRSIVTTRDGVFYQAPIGICMLTRAIEIAYIGAPVEDTVNQFVTISDSVNHTKQPWVLFSMGSSGNNGVVLLYDYYHRKWSKWFFNDSFSSSTEAFAQALTMFEDKFTWITAGGIPYSESAQFLDNGTYVSMKVESAWLKFAGLVGFQRIRNLMLLGQSQSPHNLTVSIGHNYNNSTYDESNTVAYSLLTGPSEQFRFKLTQQKSDAIRFKIQDTQNVDGLGTGEGLILSGIGLEVGAKAPLFGNLPLAQGG